MADHKYELKLCPFCGGGFRVNMRGVYEHDSKGCILHGIELHNESQIEAWNTRKPIDEVVEQMTMESFSSSDCEYLGKLVSLEDAIEIVKGGGSDEG